MTGHRLGVEAGTQPGEAPCARPEVGSLCWKVSAVFKQGVSVVPGI